MLRLVFVSVAASRLTSAELVRLMETAERNNASAGLTGRLLHHEGGFFSLLEGADEALRRLHDRMLTDPRHRGIIELVRRPVRAASFADWRMGFGGGREGAGRRLEMRAIADAYARDDAPGDAEAATLIRAYLRSVGLARPV